MILENLSRRLIENLYMYYACMDTEMGACKGLRTNFQDSSHKSFLIQISSDLSYNYDMTLGITTCTSNAMNDKSIHIALEQWTQVAHMVLILLDQYGHPWEFG